MSIGGLGRGGTKTIREYRSARRGRGIGIQVLSDSSRGSMGSAMVSQDELRAALPPRRAHGFASTGTCRACRSGEHRDTEVWQDADWKAALVTQAIFNRCPMKQSSRDSDAVCRLARIRFPVAHCPSLGQPARSPELSRDRPGGSAGQRGNMPALSPSDRESIATGDTLCKCAPPIRGVQIVKHAVAGIGDGTIDLVVTDHSPCPPAMKRLKQGDFRAAWGGIASLSVALPVTWTEALAARIYSAGHCALDGRGAARLAGCQAARADLRRAAMRTWLYLNRGGVSGDARAVALSASHVAICREKLLGRVKATYLRGQPVFLKADFSESQVGGNGGLVALHYSSHPFEESFGGWRALVSRWSSVR